MVTRKIWGLREKIYRNDFSRKWMLFKHLVQSIMAYGVELWGRKMRTRKDNVKLRQVDFQIRFLYPKVCNYEGAGNG